MTLWDTTKALMTRPLWVGMKKAPSAGLPLPRRGDGWGAFGLTFGRASVDYRAKAGDISRNSAVAACLQWITTSWPQQVAEVILPNGDKDEPQSDHPFLALLTTPSDQYEGLWLQQALLHDFWVHGRAYCYVLLNGAGEPGELQYLPAYCTRAKPGPDGRLGYYDYRPDGKMIKVDPAQVLHFRFGIDPHDLLEGRPPLLSADCEIVADNHLSEWGAALAENSGVPSGLLSPASSGPDSPYEPISPEDGRVIKENWREKTTGTNRGDVMVMPAPLKYDRIAFSPKEMSVAELRKTPEERICALFQVPPGVVGLGAGLDRNTFSNYKESKKAAWEDNLVPTGDYFASVWTKCLRMYGGSEKLRVKYTREGVRCLHEDETSKHEEAIDQKAAGLITLVEARAALGYDTDAETLAQLEAEKPVPPPMPAGDPFAGKSYVKSVKKKRLTSPA